MTARACSCSGAGTGWVTSLIGRAGAPAAIIGSSLRSDLTVSLLCRVLGFAEGVEAWAAREPVFMQRIVLAEVRLAHSTYRGRPAVVQTIHPTLDVGVWVTHVASES